MKTLYLHIGMPKTGTSAVQRFLFDNREVLETKNYCFRTMPFRYQEAAMVRNAYFMLGPVYDEDGKPSKKAKKKRQEEGLEIIKSWFESFDNVILTDESIWNHVRKHKKKNVITMLKDFCEECGITLRVIVYLRRQDEYAVSWWRQRIRTGLRLDPWDTFIDYAGDRIVLDYNENLQQIEQYIPMENIIVRRYDRSGFFGGSVYADFLNAIGLELTDDFVIEHPVMNPSLDLDFAEIKRILNQLQPEDSRIRSGISNFFEPAAVECSALVSGREPQRLYSKEESREILAQYEEGNQQIAERYFGESTPLFSCEHDSDAEKWTADNKYMREDTILYFGSLCLNLHEQFETQKAQMNERFKEQEKTIQLLQKSLGETTKELRKFEEDLNSVKKFLRVLHKIKTLNRKD